jgi:protein-tyrosine phosphatase
MGEWLATGALIQITAASLHGRFGQAAQQVCQWLLERNWVHFVATDAHNLTTRPPQLRVAYDAVAEKYGEETAERLCVTNPRAAFNGEPLPEQPEMVGLEAGHDASSGKSGPKKTGVLGRLFRANN